MADVNRPKSTTAESADAQTAPASLRRGAVGLPGVLMQAVTHIGPALGLVAGVQFATSLAGVNAPLVYLVALGIILLTGLSVIQLAKHLPSAGGYYTYVSRTVSPRAGLFTSIVFLLYEPAACFVNLAFTAYLAEQLLKSEYGFTLNWWVIFTAGILLIGGLLYLGVQVSARTLLLLGSAEIIILVALAMSGLANPGPGGVNLSPFNPQHIPSGHNFYLAIVFSIFTYAGFESVAPLAEETANPRRNLPRAILWSILAMGVFYLLCSWGVLVGWGTDRVNQFINSGENPVFALARSLWGGAWIIVLLAVINSALAISLAAANATTRVAFALGRGGVLPKFVGYVHPRYRTPSNAILLLTAVSLSSGLILGFWGLGPTNELFFFGVVITLLAIIIYSMGNIGVFLYYRSDRRAEFNPWLHFIFPLLSTISLLWVGYKSVNPLPAPPVKYAPFVVAGWAVFAIIVTFVMSRTGKERWIRESGEIIEEGAPHTEQPVVSRGK